MPRTRFALILWILTALPGTGQAQGAVPTAGLRQTELQTLKDSQWVRFTSPVFGRQQEQLLERGPTELVLSSPGRPLRVPATTIDTLWTRGTSVKTGAMTGTLIGVALGAGLGMAAHNTTEAMALAGGAGLGGGGLLGALIGLNIPRWHRQYP